MNGQRIRQFRQAGAVRKGRTAGIPFRQTGRPQPVCTIFEAREAVADRVLKAIREVHRHRSCLAYLFVSGRGDVYVLAEDHHLTCNWSKYRKDWWRGVFGNDATVADVAREVG